MGAAERVIAEDVEEVLEELYRGLGAEVNRAHRYLFLARLAREDGLSGVAAVLDRASEDGWERVSALMRRVTELGGDLGSHALAVEPSEQLARIAHPAGRSNPRGHLRALLLASLEEDRSTVRFYADLCDKTWDADAATAELALRSLIEETEAEDRLKRLLAE